MARPLKRTDKIALTAGGIGLVAGLLTMFVIGPFAIVVGLIVTGIMYRVILKQSALERIADSKILD